MSPCRSIHTPNPVNIVFFTLMPALTFIALPWYVWRVGLSPVEWRLFWVYVFATGLAITVGYHRLFAHRAFHAHPMVTCLSLVFGAAAFEQSALMWASQHRDHHRYVDTELDPYNIKKGFWYAHIGWLLFWRQDTDYSNVKDLAADPLIRHQHEHYLPWAITTGIAVPLAVGAATGHLLGTFLLAVAARLTLVHHSTFSINSVCHTFGKATYDITLTARDHWLVAFITNGEGYHNFHHRFASDYRNGVRWYQWDPSKWVIAGLSYCGLASKLYRTPKKTILAAKMAAEQRLVERALAPQAAAQDVGALLAAVHERYQALRSTLYEWERSEKELRRLRATVTERSQTYVDTLRRQVAAQRRIFAEARRQWIAFINTHPLIPHAARI